MNQSAAASLGVPGASAAPRFFENNSAIFNFETRFTADKSPSRDIWARRIRFFWTLLLSPRACCLTIFRQRHRHNEVELSNGQSFAVRFRDLVLHRHAEKPWPQCSWLPTTGRGAGDAGDDARSRQDFWAILYSVDALGRGVRLFSNVLGLQVFPVPSIAPPIHSRQDGDGWRPWQAR